jgi:hypothetical protein
MRPAERVQFRWLRVGLSDRSSFEGTGRATPVSQLVQPRAACALCRPNAFPERGGSAQARSSRRPGDSPCRRPPPRSARTAGRMGRRVRAPPRASRARVRRRLPRTPTAGSAAYRSCPARWAASHTRRTGGAPRRAALRARSQPRTDRSTPIALPSQADRARRGGSGVLYSQSALARPNPRPRDAVFEASTPPPGVDGQVPRGGRS